MSSSNFQRLAIFGCLTFLICGSKSSPAQPIGPPATQEADPGLGSFVDRFVNDRRSLEFKYREPLSPLRRQRMNEFYRVYRAELDGIDPTELSIAGIVDYTLMKNEIGFRMSMAEIDQAKDDQAMQLMPGLGLIIGLLEQHELTHRIDPKPTAELFVATSIKVNEANRELSLSIRQKSSTAELQAAELQVAALRAANAVSNLRRRLRDLNSFYTGYDPMYSWWCKTPHETLDKDLDQLGTTLRKAAGDSDNPNKILGQPIGEQAMQLELDHEMIPYTPAELIEIAEREFEWCDREMLAASQEMGFGDDWQAAMEAVKERHVPPGKQPAMIRELALEAIEFLKARNLVTVPPLCEEIWRMEMMSPERQRVNPFFLGGDTIIVSYPTDTMTHAEKLMSMRGNNEHFARATVHHELIPGHHLQGFMNDRYRKYRREFNTPFWIEGWALYWEMMLWDKDFARSPEDRIGMLFWRKHRCARIVFSLGYQLGRMSPEECVTYLIERVGHEPLNAEAEVRRSVMGGYGALYQAAYMLGGLQIRALREELVESGKISEVDFHDAILREGPMPITMVRAMLRGQHPDPDNPNTWRFAD